MLYEDIKGLDLKSVSREDRGMGLSWAFYGLYCQA